MRKRLLKILIYSLIATVICQIGTVITCIHPASVMHMPTVKNTILVLGVAFLMAVGVEVFFDIIVGFDRRCAAWVTLLLALLVAVWIRSLFSPMISVDGKVAYRYPMLAAIGFGVLGSELFARKIKPDFKQLFQKPDFTKPETVYFTLILVLGIIFSFLLPRTTVTGIDDNMHYGYTLTYSEGFYRAFNEDDTDLIYGWDETKDAQNHSGDVYVDSDAFAFSLNRVGYLGPTMGLWVGRILGLNTHSQFLCGRLGGLLLYAIIIYYAIRKLRNGKHLLGLIALAPVSIHLSAAFSYDAWLLAFTALGFAYFFGELQRPGKKLSLRDCCIMIGALFIGTWVKMPYAVMLLILLFMPKEKFDTPKQYRIYLAVIIGCIFFEFVYTIATSFGLGEVADYRGGGEVSGTGQLAYIKSNLLTYLKIISSSVLGLMHPFGSNKYLSYFFYFGDTNAYVVIVSAMILAALIDNEVTQYNILARVAGLIILIGLLYVIVTSMYISFTPVGSDMVLGVQPRYTLQLLFPAFMLVLSGWFVYPKLKSQIVNCLFYAVSAGCLIYNMVVLL